MQRRSLLQLISAAAAASAALPAFAQSGGPLRIITFSVAGGTVDVMTRTLAQSMGKTLNRTVIVDNKPGAAGLITIRALQTAQPNGDTIMFHNSTLVSLPLLQKNTNYDPFKDFAPIAGLGTGPNFLMVHKSVPAKNVAEFIAWAKLQKDGVECGNGGIGTGGHLISMLFAKTAGFKMLPVAYKGAAEVSHALIGGEVKMMLTTTTDALNAQVKEGNVRILAAASDKPTPLAPGVPTISQTLPGFSLDGWNGMFAPAGTPPAQVAELSDALRIALSESEVKQKFAQMYQEARYENSQQLTQSMERMSVFWKRVVNELNLTPT